MDKPRFGMAPALSSSPTPSRGVIVLAVLAALVVLVRLGARDLWPPDEIRYARVAKEMVATGDYLVPRVGGVAYHAKPPLRRQKVRPP